MTDATGLKDEKKRLRQEVLSRRAALYRMPRARAALTHALDALPDVRGRRLALYAGFRDELDPMPLVDELLRRGAVVGLPVVIGPRRPLVFRRYARNGRFTLSGFGIRELDERTPVVVPEIVLAPLVAIDRRGVRLGYGGGFYDRTLAGWAARGHRPKVFGLAFEAQLVPRLPRDRHDVRLDGLITEAGIRRFR
ncbi:MAG: 5-formyltetrahydrofolate cyclo-ligase [Minwuia sp.]|uniref:5-formyltetrahydrofolate cyclo-ligase n=1 Tax=Minwuia sp. TaxID=2493630 RepID=UPI003A855ABF